MILRVRESISRSFQKQEIRLIVVQALNTKLKIQRKDTTVERALATLCHLIILLQTDLTMKLKCRLYQVINQWFCLKEYLMLSKLMVSVSCHLKTIAAIKSISSVTKLLRNPKKVNATWSGHYQRLTLSETSTHSLLRD
jgi:hypothetical protein